MLLLARILSLLLIGVLVDASAATVSGAALPLGAALGGAALALIALAVFWQRAWLAVAFGCLAVALAFSVGGLAGSDAGPAMIGWRAADTAAGVFAASLVIAAIVVCLAVRSPAVTVVAVLMGLYAIVPTLLSIGRGGLPAAFVSGPLAWTRGTYVGAEILLPAAALVALVFAFIELFRKRGVSGSAALVVAATLLAATHLGAYAAGTAGLPTIVAFEHPFTRTILERIDATTSPSFIPKGSADIAPEVAAAAASLPDGPDGALQFVARMSDDLYPGALGGAVGALRSGAANSIDKALLLHDLLHARVPNLELAFARCTLSDHEADELISHVRAAHAVHAKNVMQLASSASDGVTDPHLRESLHQWARAWKAVAAQTQDDGKRLTSALQEASLTLPSDRPSGDSLRAIASRHVWVRARVNGAWTDLDPTLEPATTGKTRCAPQGKTAALPNDFYDVLGIRIVAEEQRGGALQRNVLLESAMRTSAIADRDVSFMFAETVGMNAALERPSPAPSGAMAFTPLLRVAGQNVTGTAILLPTPSGTDAATSAAADATQALSAEGPRASPSAGAPALPQVASVWMELALSSPDGQTITARSPIFDRIGYAARLSKAPLPTLSRKLETQNYVAMQTVWNVAVGGASVAAGGGPGEDLIPGDDVAHLSPALARLNSAYFMIRRALVDDARNGNVALAALQPSISLLAMTRQGLSFDVAIDGIVPLATDDARTTWAMASVLAERIVTHATAMLTTDNVNTKVGNDAASTLEGATKMISLHSADGAIAAGMSVSDDARVRMSAHLAQGKSLLAMAPNGSPNAAFAYWIVDPASGTLRDEDAFGHHPEGAEDATVTKEVPVRSYSAWRKLTCSILPNVRVAVFLLHALVPGGSASSAAGEAAAIRSKAEAAAKAAQDGLEKPTCGGAP